MQELSQLIDQLQLILAENSQLKDHVMELTGVVTDRDHQICEKQREIDELSAGQQESEHSRKLLEGALRAKEE